MNPIDEEDEQSSHPSHRTDRLVSFDANFISEEGEHDEGDDSDFEDLPNIPNLSYSYASYTEDSMDDGLVGEKGNDSKNELTESCETKMTEVSDSVTTSSVEMRPKSGSSMDSKPSRNSRISQHSMTTIPFMSIYDDPKPFSDPSNCWTIPGCYIKIKIIDCTRDLSYSLLNPHIYTIEIEHASDFKWTVTRRYNQFQDLHQSLLLFRASLNIPFPSRKHRERRRTIAKSSRKRLPRFPRKPDALITSTEAMAKRTKELEDYLSACLRIPMYRTHHQMMTFLDISPLSFVDQLGHKGKEVIVHKRAGGFRQATCCTRILNFCTDITGHWRKRWFICKDSCVVYMRPKDGKIRAVMLMDQGWSTKCGASSLGVHHGLRISNLSRDLMLKCSSNSEAKELAEYLLETGRTRAKDFTHQNRFNSFVPERRTTPAQWFIDGANLFEAISEAMEQAKEEIFIADWMLSPEIYMRRPVIHGDEWRLDRILQRKASQGVKVFLIVYRENELALGINSSHTKHWLMRLHPNIKVLRSGSFLYTHHEKIVIVDQSVAFVGGIDLCYGRWDNYEHRIADLGGISVDPSVGSRDSTDSGFSTIRTSIGTTKVRSISQPIVGLHMENSIDDTKPSILLTSDINVNVNLNGSNNNKSFIEDHHQVSMSPHGQPTIPSTPNQLSPFDAPASTQQMNESKSPSSPPPPSPATPLSPTATNKNNFPSPADPNESLKKMFEEISQELIAQAALKEHKENSHEGVAGTSSSGDKMPNAATLGRRRLSAAVKTQTDRVAKAVKGQKLVQTVARLRTIQRFTRGRREREEREREARENTVTLSDEDDNDTNVVRRLRRASEAVLNQMGLQGGSKLWYGKDYSNLIVKDFAKLDQPMQDLIDRNTTPRMPWHDLGCLVTGTAARDVARHFIQRWNHVKMTKVKYNKIYPWLLPKAHSDNIPVPKFLLKYHSVSCQVVRSVSSWSAGTKITETSILHAYIDAINTAKHYIYIENQFFITFCGKFFGMDLSGNSNVNQDVYNTIGEALYWRILRAHRQKETFRVIVLFPLLPAFEGEIGTTKGAALQAITHYNYTSIKRGGNSLLEKLQREIASSGDGSCDVSQYISFYGLRNHGELHSRLATELVYVHSKLLLIDDRQAIIGSSNINDRSMLGNRDSEIALVITDEHYDDSIMNGHPYKAGKFCGSLRRMLMREHLGLIEANTKSSSYNRIDLRDPIIDAFYRDIWLKTAISNSAIYEQVFSVVPTDQVRSFAQLKVYLEQPKLAQTDPEEAKRVLAKVNGHLVCMPLLFLCEENLTPTVGTKEGIVPKSVWT